MSEMVNSPGASAAGTYCNPLSLPHYQRGRACFSPDYQGRDFREMADPMVLRFQGRWHLFPSAGMHWQSHDMVHWEYVPVEPFDPGYAPTVVLHGDWLYLTASWDGSAVWRARDPRGPWEKMGKYGEDADGNPTWLRDQNGNPVRWGDPCLFSDKDGSLYCYCNLGHRKKPTPEHPWKIGNEPGIFGVKLDDKEPFRFAEAPKKLISFNPAHWWERTGEFNQRVNEPILEGAWMTRYNGLYYLQYSGNCTEFRNYSIGCYVGETPMGPFIPQKRNPILIHRGGLINGCGHHSVVEGPDNRLWCFYTTLVRIEHPYERRISMDPVGFDEDGEMLVMGPTETPQWAPENPLARAACEGPGLVAVSVNCPVTASSCREGRNPEYAIDNHIRTWWQAADFSLPQWLQVDLEGEFRISAARILFADRGLNYAHGIVPGPYAYRILGSQNGKDWTLLLDRSRNSEERHIAYETWPEQSARHVRLEVMAVPPGMQAGVWEFTVFGLPQHLVCRDDIFLS